MREILFGSAILLPLAGHAVDLLLISLAKRAQRGPYCNLNPTVYNPKPEMMGWNIEILRTPKRRYWYAIETEASVLLRALDVSQVNAKGAEGCLSTNNSRASAEKNRERTRERADKWRCIHQSAKIEENASIQCAICR